MNATSAPLASRSFLDGYLPVPAAYDEMVATDGSIRDSWRNFIGSFERSGKTELSARRKSVNRIIQENGVTFNIHGDTKDVRRSWELDLVPFLIPASEWKVIEAGLIQRTRLLNAVLADVYGPQRLLQEACLPRALINANPNFLRPCFGIQPPNNLFILLHAVDLARERRVFLKTLEGLQQVDVIFRRVDDAYCDPLELWADSAFGVPGLLESTRAGNVAVANAVGSGAVQTPAITAFLPSLSQRLLGEELILPSVATWWCGQKRELAYVRENLKNLVIKSAFTWIGAEPVFGGRLSNKERRRLLGEIENNPFDYVAQEEIALSTIPVLEPGRLDPRPMVLRAIVCAAPNGYTVLPGGLTRVSRAKDRLVVSIKGGGTSKETWVLADGPVSQSSLLRRADGIVRLERAAAEVPSRVAENFFWLGRYAERLEDTVRLLRCLMARLVTETGAAAEPDLESVIRLLAHLDLFSPKFRERSSISGVESEVYQLIFRKMRLGSVVDIAARLGHLVFAMRDRLSSDTWRILRRQPR